MTNQNMMCDLQTGVCGEAGDDTVELIDLNEPEKKVKLYYVTDPICSHCWALEPVLRRFQEQYGHYFQFHTVMGGLLESWNGFADVSNGIQSPADVAGHWREVGEHSRMPIDGSLWLDNPVQSSYIPSRVYKIIQQQNVQLADTFLRRAREAVFAFNRNIGTDEVLADIVSQMGLDGADIVDQAAMPAAQSLLEEDFELSRSLGVRGFPTIIMVNSDNKGVKIVGARSLADYVKTLSQVLEAESLQVRAVPEVAALLMREQRLFSKEIEIMYDLEQHEVATFLEKSLPADKYSLSQIVGETYVESK
ncbi:DsbA family protein [Paenibacillus woosongensis]|uniref:DsbA family protein n=1 Tax=Paenibacillus woosongensis TaxID=307580 RepID=A0AA95I6V8_9BACL|nr:DsbA family protein [Paenibacillus woosongensis]WHX50820.1 DsbA family protein [Paenibacillus woosongensis]